MPLNFAPPSDIPTTTIPIYAGPTTISQHDADSPHTGPHSPHSPGASNRALSTRSPNQPLNSSIIHRHSNPPARRRGTRDHLTYDNLTKYIKDDTNALAATPATTCANPSSSQNHLINTSIDLWDDSALTSFLKLNNTALNTTGGDLSLTPTSVQSFGSIFPTPIIFQTRVDENEEGDGASWGSGGSTCTSEACKRANVEHSHRVFFTSANVRTYTHASETSRISPPFVHTATLFVHTCVWDAHLFTHVCGPYIFHCSHRVCGAAGIISKMPRGWMPTMHAKVNKRLHADAKAATASVLTDMVKERMPRSSRDSEDTLQAKDLLADSARSSSDARSSEKDTPTPAELLRRPSELRRSPHSSHKFITPNEIAASSPALSGTTSTRRETRAAHFLARRSFPRSPRILV